MTSTNELYILRVRALLREEQDEDHLTTAESSKCRESLLAGIEAGECAAQIIMARAESICGKEASCTN